MHAALHVLLTETVQHAAATGQDDYGNPTYAAAVSRPARVEYKVRRIVNAQGQEVISRCRVFLEGDVTIGMQDRLVLDDGTAPKLQLVYRVRDVDGSFHHAEVWM